ncbi:MAG: hypothetical protein ABIJ21_06665 [Nanoarchaeota archaeon]
METNDSDLLALGGNIQLAGFSVLDKSELIVVKKVVGSYARKFSDQYTGFQGLHLTLKELHKREKSEIFQVSGRVIIDGKTHAVEDDDRNLFFCIDAVMKKLETVALKG